METVTISKKEYNRLKKIEAENDDLIKDLVASFEDIKHGRVRRLR